MTVFQVGIYGGILCGLGCVFGALWLLSKGAIDLKVASKDPGLTVELFKDQFKITTRYPALGLFIIGFLFIGLAIYWAGNEVRPIRITGELNLLDAVVIARSEWSIVSNQGHIDGVVRPHLDILWIVATAPGHEPDARHFYFSQLKDTVDVGKLELKEKVDRIVPKSENIAPLPADVKSPPLTDRASFGVGVRP